MVEKRKRLVGEVGITTRAETTTEMIRDELRREVIDIDEEREEDRPQGRSSSTQVLSSGYQIGRTV